MAWLKTRSQFSLQQPLAELHAFTEANNISGVPILDKNNLIGIVTRRDVRFASDMSALVTSVMTPKERLVTVKEGAEPMKCALCSINTELKKYWS